MVAVSGGCRVTEGLLTGISWANTKRVARKSVGAKAQLLGAAVRHGWKPCPPVADTRVADTPGSDAPGMRSPIANCPVRPTAELSSHVFTFRPPGLAGRELSECCSRFRNGSPAQTLDQ